jgi:protein TonB
MPSRRLALALVASLLLHFFISAGVIWTEGAERPRPNSTSVEYIELADLTTAPGAEPVVREQRDEIGQVVEQESQLNDEVPPDSTRLSKFNQRVERETRAALTGRFQNSGGRGAGKSPPEEPVAKPSNTRVAQEPKSPGSEVQDLITDDSPGSSQPAVNSVVRKELQPLLPSFRPSLDQVSQAPGSGGDRAASMTDDHLDDVPTSLQTVLSTREFVYYSYYHRIKEQLRQHWEPKIKEKVRRALQMGRSIASESDRITRVVILLDQSGTLVRVQVVGQSGVQDLDQAAVEAFRAAAPFPNPPHGIVDGDGYIRIRWDFVLEA